MAAPLRFAILGFGHHAIKRLVPAFAASRHATLSGMWRRDLAAGARNCQDYGIPRCFASAEALCASPEVDAVFITSPDAMHHGDTLLALRHGKAVLCEKPLSMRAVEAEEMVAVAEAANLLFGVAQNFRYNRSLDLMRKKVFQGLIGVPQTAAAQFHYPARLSARTWIKDTSLACGGPMADVGVHCIDALRYVLGRDVVGVSTVAHSIPGNAAVDAVALLQLELTGGCFAAVTVSADAPYRSLVEVTGSDGVLIAENGMSVEHPVDVVLRRGGTAVETTTVDNADGYTRMLDSFAAAYRGEENFLATGRDGLHNMRVLDAAYRSWRGGLREVV